MSLSNGEPAGSRGEQGGKRDGSKAARYQSALRTPSRRALPSVESLSLSLSLSLYIATLSRAYPQIIPREFKESKQQSQRVAEAFPDGTTEYVFFLFIWTRYMQFNHNVCKSSQRIHHLEHLKVKVKLKRIFPPKASSPRRVTELLWKSKKEKGQRDS